VGVLILNLSCRECRFRSWPNEAAGETGFLLAGASFFRACGKPQLFSSLTAFTRLRPRRFASNLASFQRRSGSATLQPEWRTQPTGTQTRECDWRLEASVE
jgi:hypothetical protein